MCSRFWRRTAKCVRHLQTCFVRNLVRCSRMYSVWRRWLILSHIFCVFHITIFNNNFDSWAWRPAPLRGNPTWIIWCSWIEIHSWSEDSESVDTDGWLGGSTMLFFNVFLLFRLVSQRSTYSIILLSNGKCSVCSCAFFTDHVKPHVLSAVVLELFLQYLRDFYFV
jgi:hypothetical protein